MADEQDKWLNRETAERLLRGEPLQAVDAAARDQAERLSKALGALSAQAAPASGELPGEQAALAAFRKAREAAEAERPAAAHAFAAGRAPAPGADAGLVRIGAPVRTGIPVRRPRWARPARLALAAAVAVGTLGGVAVAAGSGVLPTPFDDEPARPGASVSADATPGQPLVPPSAPVAPDTGTATDAGTGTPGRRTDGHSGTGSHEAAGKDGDTGRGAPPGSGVPSAPYGTGRLGAAAACRALRDGKDLDAGRERVLERLAGGSDRVTRYCAVLLAARDATSGAANGGTAGSTGNGQDGSGGGTGNGESGNKGKNGQGGKNRENGKGEQGSQGKDGAGSGDETGGQSQDKSKSKDEDEGDDGPVRPARGDGGRPRGGVVPAPSAFAPHPGGPGARQPAATPGPTRTAL
ncbi:hypothetical protein ACE1SV_40120 [Streptomyces sp. E-15]